MKVLIIDDERRARNEMRRLLTPYSWIEVAGEAANVPEALEQVERHRPDVLFLDVQMPKQDGFQLVSRLTAPVPKIIFTTAFDEFAIRAFEVNALDYLLKPIVPERLKQTLSRLKEPESQENELGSNTPKGGGESPLRETDRVFLRDGNKCWFVSVKSIRLFESDGDYTRIYFDDQQPLIYRTVSSLEERLPSDHFFRANRKQIINLGFIASVTPWFSNTLKVTLKTGEEIEISRRSAKAFRQRLSL